MQYNQRFNRPEYIQKAFRKEPALPNKYWDTNNMSDINDRRWCSIQCIMPNSAYNKAYAQMNSDNSEVERVLISIVSKKVK